MDGSIILFPALPSMALDSRQFLARMTGGVSSYLLNSFVTVFGYRIKSIYLTPLTRIYAKPRA